ncbi:MAG: aspartate--tRNA(Asn) ligase [Candidatus Staskawiczbacteria bacterium]|nr:aspartate--tRNA(Asn) ligase [Candidatus Staskawiczbacteria bacterium]
MQRFLVNETAKHVGEKVRVAGWVNTRRSHGKILFIDLRDRSGVLQAVFVPQNKQVYELAQNLRPEWVVEITGQIVKRPEQMVNPKIETGEVELSVESLNVLSKAETPPIPVGEEVAEDPEIDTRMDWRWIDLRKPKNLLIFKVWTLMESAFREFWISNNYIEIHSPKLIATASESGSEVFEVKYFKKKAYLAQSPQFYKQMAMAAGFERVFEIGPVFRAEPSFTSRHATEFTGYDAEISFIDSHYDIMDEEERMINYGLQKIKRTYGEEIKKIFDKEIVIPSLPFPRISMKETKIILSKKGVRSEKKGDLSPEEERGLSDYIKEKYRHEFVFVTEYPVSARPFYHMHDEKYPTLTKSFDLFWGGLEITTGAQREHRYNVLVAQAKSKKMNIKKLQFYLDFFKYGCPPHGGYGMGPNRMIMKLFGIDNVRDAMFLYRGVKRLTP